MKRIAFLTVLSLAVVIGGCKKDDSKARVLKLAHGLNTEHPVHKAMMFMAERVKEKSDGKMLVHVYPSEQLGNEKECIEALQLGYLAMTKTSSGPMENFVPEIKVYGIPYLFRDSEHFWKVMKGPIGKELLVAGEEKGLRGLCYYDAGARSFYAKKPIEGPDDVEGLKVRVMSSIMAMQMIEYMGGSPTPISWGELYTSLDQGVVDAAENNPPSFYTSAHYEICDYYSLDEHTRLPDMLVISSKVWDSLTPEQQQILSEAVDESVEHQIKLWAAAEEESMEAVQEAGVTILRPDKEPFREAVKPMWEQYEDTNLGTLIERIQEVK
ncbi:C4-dicarboxylate-binding periplasmic protein precursor [Anaerohalosphaera lusitana]|uniref:C4-dicarboxylate-binding periplasmic protein n=1 Tax=Anaerohalosphaera lusitana TaxID=1936003 RepID=A0A1U9NL02_9BACT|nr:TRAP transporter substrate-binding protein [Anaerohalosphaera lusitana]AQT68622.1 C4-dicarboxylate-binding periplasmic protein precursor [Anaerohalosphaera lusitana]